jgi:hypothetical protein
VTSERIDLGAFVNAYSRPARETHAIGSASMFCHTFSTTKPTSDGGKDLGEGDEDVGRSLHPDVDGSVRRRGVAGRGTVAARALNVDVVLHERRTQHGESTGNESKCNCFSNESERGRRQGDRVTEVLFLMGVKLIPARRRAG